MNKNQFKNQNHAHSESWLFLASFNQVASGYFVVALFLNTHVHFALCAGVLCSAHKQGLKHLASDPCAVSCTHTITIHAKLSAPLEI